VLTRTTTVLGALFLIVSLGLALLSRTSEGTGVEQEARRINIEDARTNWVEDVLNTSSSENEILSDIDVVPEGAQ